MLAFGQYLKHSALELIISELKLKVVAWFFIYIKAVKVYQCHLVNSRFALVKAKALCFVSI